MKKIILFLVIVVAGCNTSTKKKIDLKPQHDAALAIEYGPAAPLALKSMLISNGCPGDHLINFNDACDLVSDMLRYERLFEMDSIHGLGGFMDSARFTKAWEDAEVIQFYPCMNRDNGDVFLSFKDVKGYKYDLSSTLCDLTDNEMLDRSTNTFTYDKDRTQVAPSDVANFISTMKTETGISEVKLDGSVVREMNDYFFTQYTINGSDLNNFHCGAMNKCEILQLLNQVDSLKVAYNCVGIRYFFSYDNTRDNKIRLVLCGVNSDGSNLIHYSTGEAAMMLEKEWPPDAPSDSSSHH